MRVQLIFTTTEADEPFISDRDYLAQAADGLVSIINSFMENGIDDLTVAKEENGERFYVKGFDVFHQDRLDEFADRIVPDDISSLDKGSEQ